MKTKFILGLVAILLMNVLCNAGKPRVGNDSILPNQQVKSKDIPIIDQAFLHGFTHNVVNASISGEKVQTLSIQCTDDNVHKGGARTSYSVWTRDLYWGFLGWAQAGNDSVLDMMKSSLRLLIAAKNKNQATGQNPIWPLNDKRFYIPQAYDQNLTTAKDLFPWCSESQADFILLAYNYWKLSGDIEFIKSIWNEITYVTKTLELMDTDGNSLPDALWGSYDYMYLTLDTEEPLMCAKTSMVYSRVADLSRILGESAYADKLETLAAKIKKVMNKNVKEGGLWKKQGNGGYYVMRKITKGEAKIPEFIRKDLPAQLAAFYSKGENTLNDFIPYENLVPMWCGMTSNDQDKAIFSKLDAGFDKYYNMNYGPMYCAPAGHNSQSVSDGSSVTWLAFLDVFLRGKKGCLTNRSKIYDMLLQHAYDAGKIPFSEGMGVYGSLTDGAGRTWDNGNYFHMLICGIYGLEKDNNNITISAPVLIEGTPLTELKNFYWGNAIYNFSWKGTGSKIKTITVDGEKVNHEIGEYKLFDKAGKHNVQIIMIE